MLLMTGKATDALVPALAPPAAAMGGGLWRGSEVAAGVGDQHGLDLADRDAALGERGQYVVMDVGVVPGGSSSRGNQSMKQAWSWDSTMLSA